MFRLEVHRDKSARVGITRLQKNISLIARWSGGPIDGTFSKLVGWRASDPIDGNIFRLVERWAGGSLTEDTVSLLVGRILRRWPVNAWKRRHQPIDEKSQDLRNGGCWNQAVLLELKVVVNTQREKIRNWARTGESRRDLSRRTISNCANLLGDCCLCYIQTG